MELSALKSVLKEMNIKFEKAHVKSSFNGQKVIKKASDQKLQSREQNLQNLKENNEKILAITFLVLLIDQASKIYIKTHFNLDDSISVFPGFKLTFVENREWPTVSISEESSGNIFW